MPVAFANHIDIQGQINDICNASPPGEWSEFIDTSVSADKRRSDQAITEARRKSAHRILEAIGMNPSHAFWGELKTDVAVADSAVIPACYGNIGSPLIVPFVGSPAMTGISKDPDEVETARGNILGSLTDFFGEEEADIQEHNEAESGFIAPMSCWYSTANGVLRFAGVSCVIPMIQAGVTEAESASIADNKVPVTFASTNVKLAIGLLIKEGDSLINLSGIYAQQGESELIQIKGGAVEVAPINVARAIQNAQRFR